MSVNVSQPKRRRRSARLRNRQLQNSGMDVNSEPIVLLDDSTIITAVEESSSIDLTSTVDEDFVDLTSSQSSRNNSIGVNDNDSSVVVIDMIESPASPRGRRHVARSQFPAFTDTDSEDDLPELPTLSKEVKNSNQSSSSTHGMTRSPADVRSPEASKITCPICFDDDKMIKRNNKKLASTSCGHVYCRPCLEEAIRAAGCCPMCRKKQTKKNILVLHI